MVLSAAGCAPRWWRLPLLLAGCASTAIQENQAATSAFALREVGVEVQLQSTADARAAAATNARTLLAEPLTADGAVQIAVGYSPTFQRLLADSAAASAAATQSARLPNPILSYSRLAAGNVTEIDRALTLSLLDFVLLPQRRAPRRPAAGAASTAQCRGRDRDRDRRRARRGSTRWRHGSRWRTRSRRKRRRRPARNSAVAWRPSAIFRASRRRREQAFYAETTADVARAQLEAQRTREVLIRLLGLSGDLADKLTLPDRLPDLAGESRRRVGARPRAFDERLDVALARAELDFTARSLGLDAGDQHGQRAGSRCREQQHDGRGDVERATSWSSGCRSLTFGDARRANAEAVYLAALNRTAIVIAEAQSHLRESYLAYRTTYDLARHYRDEIVPLRKTISEENLLRYNGMLISVFELLADAREQVSSVRQAITAQRDFWAADASLRSTLIGRPVEGVTLGLPNVTPGAGTAQPH